MAFSHAEDMVPVPKAKEALPLRRMDSLVLGTLHSDDPSCPTVRLRFSLVLVGSSWAIWVVVGVGLVTPIAEALS